MTGGIVYDCAMLIDDFDKEDLVSALGTRWRGVTDTVMGGVSRVSLSRSLIDGRRCLHMSGEVSLENRGGFVQASLQLVDAADTLDAARYTGIRLTVRGNGEEYSVHLRTTDLIRPWQSYRSQFAAGPSWQQVELPFCRFRPHRVSTPMELRRLRRLGLVAIGRAFHADLAVAEISLYSD